MTSKMIKGSSEKNALKANAPAHCAPSIRKNVLTARRSIVQTRRAASPSLLGLLKGAAGRGRFVLPTIIEPCFGDGPFTLVILQHAPAWSWYGCDFVTPVVRDWGNSLVIPWRVMLMTLLGRATPALPMAVLFSELELRVLEAYAKKTGW